MSKEKKGRKFAIHFYSDDVVIPHTDGYNFPSSLFVEILSNVLDSELAVKLDRSFFYLNVYQKTPLNGLLVLLIEIDCDTLPSTLSEALIKTLALVGRSELFSKITIRHRSNSH